MEDTSGSSGGAVWPAWRNDFLASALNVTALVAIFVVVIFTVVTQILAANGAISLSTTLQLTMWLVALGFIVLLAIAYMFSRVFERVYEIARSSQEERARGTGANQVPVSGPDANGQDKRYDPQALASQEPNGAPEGARLGQDAGTPRNPPNGPSPFRPGGPPGGSTQEAEDDWVPPEEFRRLDGSEYSVSMDEVFPYGCYLDSITPVPGKPTGQQVYECRVVDVNPKLKSRPHETVVTIPANQMPSQGSMPRLDWVEFENLAITPYLTDQNPMRIRYALRATGIQPAAAPTVREQATWTVPPAA